MRVEAKNNVLYNGVYRMPGTVFECDDISAKHLLESGAVSKEIDPKMLKAANELLEKAIEERDQLKKDLEKAISINKKNTAQIAEIEKKLETVKDTKEAKKLQKKAKSLKSSMANSGELKKQLDAKDKEIDTYSV